MKRLTWTLAIALACVVWLPVAAQAEFGLKSLDVTITNQDKTPAMQAGSHPFAMMTSFAINTFNPEPGMELPDGEVKNVIVDLPEGFVGDSTALPRCSNANFFKIHPGSFSGSDGGGQPSCDNSTAVGFASVKGEFRPIPAGFDFYLPEPLFNLPPPPGTVAKFGFIFLAVPITIEIKVNPNPPYNLIASSTSPQTLQIFSAPITVWGDPSSPVHDPYRGHCIPYFGPTFHPDEPVSAGNCPVSRLEKPFLDLPTNCAGPEESVFSVDSWGAPGGFLANGKPDLKDPNWDSRSVLTHDNATPPNPQAFTGCGKLGFKPSITGKPTTKAAQSPTGLDFSLDVDDPGLTNPEGLAQSEIKKAVVTLPEGMSTNPSIAEGLGVCTEADLARETLKSAPGEGCPNASKIGSVEVESPLVDENVNGGLFIAKPYENEFDSLLALYIVIKNPKLGIILKQTANVERDPETGQLTTVVEDIPQLPFSHFKLHFREGARSPLASPPACGTYDVKAELTPWSGGDPIVTTSAFQIISGPDAGPCPAGGLPPFRPGLTAGTINNAAGRFSPFNVRLFRSDSEQEMTHFSIKLPPGITGKLAGIPFCPDAAIAAAKARTGPLGGHEELEHPSCPAASEIGRTLVGSGVGSALTYAPGKVYLSGPYNGSSLSLVAITSGVVGPFDIGTVVVREAFKIDPETAEVFIDATGSDPIPHIIQGIPVHLRDIRVYTDRPEFVLNPTDCDRTSTASTVLGSGLDFVSEADDNPITVSTPFQAADCAALPFKPKLSLRLIGGTKRGAHPKFVAKLKMNGIGEAAIARAQVTLPHSEFLENAHIKTICTRVQFNQGAVPGEKCPAASIYGRARAVTPILEEPLEGPIFLRSSEHQLPDLVAAFHNGKINVNLVGKIDSVKGGGIRNTFETVPDAPVTSATFIFQGQKKGLLVNSTNLCKGTHRAEVNFDGHNGKAYDIRPALVAKCGGKGRKGKRAQRHGRPAR